LQRCSKCGQTFDAESCPFCGNPTQVSPGVGWEDDKSLNKYAVLLFAGLVGDIAADALYTPLDVERLAGAALVLIFVPSGIFFGLLVCKPKPWYLLFVKRMFGFVGVVLALYSAFIILNGALDHYPLVHAETRVVRTYRAGRSGDFYIVVSPSWRQGRNQEHFQPIGDFDGDLQTGDFIRVEVHRGALWLPWDPTVTDRMRCPSGVYGPSLC
jgi:hypothetical protein